MNSDPSLQAFLSPAYFVESNHPDVVAYAKSRVQGLYSDKEKAIALFYAVRDGFWYDPYTVDLNPDVLKASNLLKRDRAYCVEKACLLTALGRAVGIPSRLGFVIVKNHMGTARLEEVLKTDHLVFHGNTEFYLDGRWVKVTPAFNKELCEKLNVAPLEFNGADDAIFQQYDRDGSKFMEYLHDYGNFPDVPYALFVGELMKHYPHLFENGRDKVVEGWVAGLPK